MPILEGPPLQRAKLRSKELETELRKSPDFQLYLITKAAKERVRMEHLLLQIPEFKLWHLLRSTIRKANREARVWSKAAAKTRSVPQVEPARHYSAVRADRGSYYS